MKVIYHQQYKKIEFFSVVQKEGKFLYFTTNSYDNKRLIRCIYLEGTYFNFNLYFSLFS